MVATCPSHQRPLNEPRGHRQAPPRVMPAAVRVLRAEQRNLTNYRIPLSQGGASNFRLQPTHAGRYLRIHHRRHECAAQVFEERRDPKFLADALAKRLGDS